MWMCRPSRMFWSTVAPCTSSMLWNVREIPRRATRCGAIRVMSVSPNRTAPDATR